MSAALLDALFLAAAGFLAGFLLYRSFVFAAHGADLSPLNVDMRRWSGECVDIWHWPFGEWGLPNDCEWRAAV